MTKSHWDTIPNFIFEFNLPDLVKTPWLRKLQVMETEINTPCAAILGQSYAQIASQHANNGCKLMSCVKKSFFLKKNVG